MTTASEWAAIAQRYERAIRMYGTSLVCESLGYPLGGLAKAVAASGGIKPAALGRVTPERRSALLKACRAYLAAGMPEAGYLPIPKKLARQGVKDMVRISDCRMSGTAFGTIVLHVTPEAAIGGPLAHVRNGDRIRLSVKNREIALLVSDEELARRATESPVVEPSAERGYRKLFLQTVTQADQGVDFDFLRAPRTIGKAPEK